MPLYTENCPKCGKRNMTFWEFLAFDECSVCREKENIMEKNDLIKLIGQIGNELMAERKSISEKIIVQQTISRLVQTLPDNIKISIG